VEAPLASVAEQLRQEGFQLGVQLGLQQSLQPLRETLRVVLAQRFGQLDAGYDERIEAADVAELHRLVLRVVPATQLADVFATD
jgi:hypothetical protein